MILQSNVSYMWNSVVNPRLGVAPYAWGGTFSSTNVTQGTDCSGAVAAELQALLYGPEMNWGQRFSTMTFAGAQPGDTGPFGDVAWTADLVCVGSLASIPSDAAMIISVLQNSDPSNAHMICRVQGVTIEMGGDEFTPDGHEQDYHTSADDANCTAINNPEFNQFFYLPGPIGTPMQGLDYAGGRPPGADILKAGFQFVCRYVFNDTSGQLPSKLLTASEAQDLLASGVDIVSNWESSGTMGAGFATGASDAQQASANHIAAGGPPAAPIYFSVDYDAPESDQPLINAYFQGVASVIGLARTAAYGGYWVIKRLFDAGLISYGWQTEAWSGDPGGIGPDDAFGDGYYCDPRVSIYQRNSVGFVNVDGVQCDVNVSLTANFGSWRTYTNNNPPPPPPTPTPGNDPNVAAGVQSISDKIDGLDGDGNPLPYRLVDLLAPSDAHSLNASDPDAQPYPYPETPNVSPSELDHAATLAKIWARTWPNPNNAADVALAGGKVFDSFDMLVTLTKANLSGSTPTPVPNVTPTPTPAPPPTPAPVPIPVPVPIPGKNTLGPSEWLAVGGIVLNGVIYTAQQAAHLLPPVYGNAIMGLVALLTMVGVYHAPSSSNKEETPHTSPTPASDDPTPPTTPPPTPVPTPTPTPDTPGTLSDVLAHAAAEAAASALADAQPALQQREVDAIKDRIKKTLGT